MLIGAYTMFGIRAPKTPYQYKQPDGSIITLVNHGDEFHSWTTCNGQVMTFGADGFWRPAANQVAARSAGAEVRRMRQEFNEMLREARESSISMGEKPFLVILVEFNDLSFTIANPKQAFTNLLNEENYSANGGTGSARDFYVHSSDGAFKPTFEVVGPVKISQGYAYYGQDYGSSHNRYARDGFLEACQLADSQLGVDFSRYDVDGDGAVDNIFFYYAGHNQAEGGSADTIWPHASRLSSASRFDGKSLGRYACTSEYRGSSGTTMCGIGTFCHEFGHVLGLPDFYDTDYEDNGDAKDMKAFSLMSSGPYNNNGRTPPRLNALERNMLGWMDDAPLLTKGQKTLRAIQNKEAYRIPTPNNGEYFYIETRDGSSWDKYIPTGLMVYHVDRSNTIVASGRTANSLWSNNDINCYASHPCCYLVASSNYNNNNYIMFPGNGNVTTFNPVPWSNEPLSYVLNNIAYSGGVTTFDVTNDTAVKLKGTVYDMDGNPLSGASVNVAPASSAAPGTVKSSAVEKRDAVYSCTTGADGKYELVLNDSDRGKKFDLSASLGGYITKTIRVEASSLVNEQDIYLRKVGTIEDYTLRKYNPNGSFGSFGYASQEACSIMAAYQYSPKEIAPYVGTTLTNVSFQVNAVSCDALYVVVFVGDKLALKRAVTLVTDDAIRADISDANIVIPAGKELTIGYAIENARDNNSGGTYPVIYDKSGHADGGCIYASVNYSSPSWKEWSNGNLIIAAKVLGDTDPGTGEASFAILGYNSLPFKESYSAGETYTFKIEEAITGKPVSVEWYFDGSKTTAESKTLTAGKHTVTAILTYGDGSTEEITAELNVN